MGPHPLELVREGHLARVQVMANHHPQMGDDSLLRVDNSSADGYSTESVQAFEKSLNLDLALSIIAEQPPAPCIWFTASAHAAKTVAERTGGHAVLADTPDRQRRKLYAEFSAGEVQTLATVGVLTEGVDLPNCKRICIIRPTRSTIFLLQAVGRAVRPVGGDAEVWDFGGSLKRLGAELGRHDAKGNPLAFDPQSEINWSAALEVTMDTEPGCSPVMAGTIRAPVKCPVCGEVYSPSKVSRLCTRCLHFVGSMCATGCGRFTRNLGLVCNPCLDAEMKLRAERQVHLGLVDKARHVVETSLRAGVASAPGAEEQVFVPVRTGEGTTFCKLCGGHKKNPKAGACTGCYEDCKCGKGRFDPTRYSACWACNERAQGRNPYRKR